MNWTEFFAMGGRGFYVWGAFGVFAAAIALEIILLRARMRRALPATRENGEATV